MLDEINETYLKLDKFFKLKINAQLRNSGYVFYKLRYIHDLVSDEKYYVTIFNDQTITFLDRDDLIKKLSIYIDGELRALEVEFEQREQQRGSNRNWDDYNHFNLTEENSHKQNKLSQILEKLKK